MITRIRGIYTEAPDDNHVVIEVSGIYYEILLPTIVMNEMREKYQLGDEITLSTIYEIETAGGFGHMSPRLIGFLNDKQKQFFIRLIKVKDFGAKRAMKSLVAPIDEVANAIETGDVKFLVTLPEIGQRSAERMIAELKGKMLEFVTDSDIDLSTIQTSSLPEFKRDAVTALSQLGFKEQEALKMINNALTRNPEISETDELIKEVFRQSKK